LLAVESVAASRLKILNEDKPLLARYNIGAAPAVIADILDQAQQKKRAKDVAEYLVGAKIQLRCGPNTVHPKNVNTPNRNEPADFRVGSAAIEVTVNSADSRHVEQIKRILDDTGLDVWLLVRLCDREKWKNVIDATFGDIQAKRIVVADIETFVGQNVSEIGCFVSSKVSETLSRLFDVYNEHWLPAAGTSGLRIVTVDPEHK